MTRILPEIGKLPNMVTLTWVEELSRFEWRRLLLGAMTIPGRQPALLALNQGARDYAFGTSDIWVLVPPDHGQKTRVCPPRASSTNRSWAKLSLVDQACQWQRRSGTEGVTVAQLEGTPFRPWHGMASQSRELRQWTTLGVLDCGPG